MWGGRFLAFLEIVELDEPPFADPLGESRDEAFLVLSDVGLRGLGEVELAERLLELAADAVERRSRVSAAISGPTNSSASRIARASSGVSRGGARKVSPKSSLSTRTCPSSSWA